MISIILNAWDSQKFQRHMTIACIADIVRFTDPPYELIVVDNEPKFPIRDDYKVFPNYKLVTNDPKKNVYECYNQGAKKANGDKLMFIQNDVFVHERTINKLARYLDEWDVAFPQQVELSREDILEIYDTPDGEATKKGWRDAGLLAITKKAFDKSGGWDKRYRNLLGEKAYYRKIDEAGLSWTSETNAIVTHIKAANNLSKPEKLYVEEMEHDASIG